MEVSNYEIIKCDEYYSFCSVADYLQQKLVAHFQEIHGEDNFASDDYSKHCYCIDSKDLQEELINHILSHLLSKNFQHPVKAQEPAIEQEIIVEEFHLDVDLFNLNASVTLKPKKYHSCHQCSMKYKTAKALANHFRNEHDQSNNFLCPYQPDCSSRFSDDKKLKTHINRHEAKLSLREDGNYYCRVCDKPCATRDFLIQHVATHNHDYSCDYCSKTFTKYEFMKNHVIQHVHGRQPKEHKKVICELCSQWVQRDRMKRHFYQKHSDARNFKCQQCGKAFKYPNSLRDHLDIHANNPRFNCPVCNKKFFNHTNYRNHMNKHKNSLPQETPEKLHCPHKKCDKIFSSKSTLKTHIKKVHKNKVE